jgi:hypothetical protein
VDSPNPSIARVYQTTTTATLTLNVDTYDAADITAQAQAITIANPTGTPTNVREINYRVRDNGTARAISFGNQFEALANSDLPTTTVVGEGLLFTAVWNATTSKWQVQNSTGGVVGPASATDSNFAAFDTTTGKLLKDSNRSASSFATAAQGALAATALQPATGVMSFDVNQTPSSVTGTLSQTILHSVLIPAGTFQANDTIEISALYTKIGS